MLFNALLSLHPWFIPQSFFSVFSSEQTKLIYCTIPPLNVNFFYYSVLLSLWWKAKTLVKTLDFGSKHLSQNNLPCISLSLKLYMTQSQQLVESVQPDTRSCCTYSYRLHYFAAICIQSTMQWGAPERSMQCSGSAPPFSFMNTGSATHGIH